MQNTIIFLLGYNNTHIKQRIQLEYMKTYFSVPKFGFKRDFVDFLQFGGLI